MQVYLDRGILGPLADLRLPVTNREHEPNDLLLP